MFFRNMLRSTLLFSSSTSSTNTKEKFFENIYGYDNIKRLFRMALESTQASTSILLSGPPASAKTLFLRCLMKLQNSYFIDCSNATKSGVMDCIFDYKQKYLLLDELDKLSRKNQTFLLNLIETGIVSETKHNKTRSMASVFATSKNIENIIRLFQLDSLL
jgi:replication-associated recombination protein RarA